MDDRVRKQNQGCLKHLRYFALRMFVLQESFAAEYARLVQLHHSWARACSIAVLLSPTDSWANEICVHAASQCTGVGIGLVFETKSATSAAAPTANGVYYSCSASSSPSASKAGA